MVLSSDENEILEYLKSWKGSYVSLVEICRSAGGRQRFKDTPNWANPYMSQLVEAKLAEGNDRGHFRYVEQETAKPKVPAAVPQNDAAIVGEDYFPSTTAPEAADAAPKNDVAIVGDDYFPTATVDDEEQKRWIAPHIAEILRNAGKKFGGQSA